MCIEYVDIEESEFLMISMYLKNLDTNKIEFLLGYVDLGSYTIKQISLNFLPHGIALDPNNYKRLFVFEKVGPGACVVNLEDFNLEQYIPPSKDCYFYGHGMPNKDGSLTFQIGQLIQICY